MRKGSLDRCDGKKRCDRLGRLWRLRQDTGLAGSETRHQIGRRAARRTNLRGDRGYVDAMRMAAFRGSIRAEGSGLSRRQSPGFSPARAARSLLMDAWISEASRPSIAFTAGGGARKARRRQPQRFEKRGVRQKRRRYPPGSRRSGGEDGVTASAPG